MVVAFSAINLLLPAFGINFYLLFSATVPQLIYEISRSYSAELQNDALLISGFITAFIIVGIFLICWLLSKRRRVFILIALILFGVDSLIFLLLAIAAGFNANLILDTVFHGLVTYYLAGGAIAWKKLRGIDVGEYNAALNDVVTATQSKTSKYFE